MVKILEFVVIVIYLVAMIGIGVYYVKRASLSESDFYVAGRSISGFWGGLAIASDYTSAGTLVAGVGLALKFGGWGLFIWPCLTIIFGFLLFAFTLGPSLHRKKFTTLPDFFEQHGSLTLRAVASFIILFIMGVYLIVQLKAGGLIGEYVLGISYEYSVVIMGATYIIYVFLGGMASSIWTGVVQMIMMLLAVVLLAVSSLVHTGGLAPMMLTAAEKAPWFMTVTGKIGVEFPVTYGFIMMFIMLSMPHVLMRGFSARTETDARRTFLWGGFWTGVFYLFFLLVLVAMVTIVMPNDRPDMAWILLTGEVLPSRIMVGFALASLLAATMSTTSAQLMAASSAISHDIYDKILKRRKEISPDRLAKIARISSLAVGISTIAIALDPPLLVGKMLILAGSLAGASFVVPLFAGLYWHRANKYSIGAAMIGGFCSVILTHPIFNIFPLEPQTWPGIIGVGVSAALMIIVSFLMFKDVQKGD